MTTNETYEPPTVVVIGSFQDLTQGQLFSPGQDSLSWIPIIGQVFGS